MEKQEKQQISDGLQKIYDAGYKAGYEEGIEKGREIEEECQTIRHLNRIIQALKIEPEAAMLMLQIPRDKRKSYQKIFSARIKQKPEKYRK